MIFENRTPLLKLNTFKPLCKDVNSSVSHWRLIKSLKCSVSQTRELWEWMVQVISWQFSMLPTNSWQLPNKLAPNPVCFSNPQVCTGCPGVLGRALKSVTWFVKLWIRKLTWAGFKSSKFSVLHQPVVPVKSCQASCDESFLCLWLSAWCRPSTGMTLWTMISTRSTAASWPTSIKSGSVEPEQPCSQYNEVAEV